MLFCAIEAFSKLHFGWLKFLSSNFNSFKKKVSQMIGQASKSHNAPQKTWTFRKQFKNNIGQL
jgi:hypothetical protein